MKIQDNPKVIGSFVLGALTLIVIVFVVFGSGNYFADKFYYVIFFRGSVNGLRVGAPIKLRGVNIGSVKQISPLYDQEGDFYIEVIIENIRDVIKNVGDSIPELPQDEELQYLIDRGLRAQLNTESLVLGHLYILVDYFPDTPIILSGLNEEYLEIPSIPTKSAELESSVRKSISSIGDVQFSEISFALLETLQGIDSLIGSSQMERNMIALEGSLKEARKLFKSLDQRVVNMSESLVNTTERMNGTLDKVEKLFLRLDNIAAEDRFELHKTLKELGAAARALRLLADHLERNPNDIIFGKD